MTIHTNPTLPEGGKARRVYLLLREEISNGAHAAGALLPGENRLAQTYNVSRVTIRKALEALAADGWVEKRLGAGSVVLERREAAPEVIADFASLMPQIVEMDRITTVRLLSFSYDAAPNPVAKALGLAPKAQVQTAIRVRSVGGQSFSHLTTHVPEGIARNYTEADLAAFPLFRLLERSGVDIDSARQSVSAVLATPDVADALNVTVGSPLLSLKRTVWDANGTGVEFLAALYRPDLFHLHMNLSRVGDGKARHWEPVLAGAPE